MKGKVHEETHAVRVAGVAMVYTLERKSVRNINLRIRPDASIYVSAPHRVPLAEIERFIQQGFFYYGCARADSELTCGAKPVR